MNDASPTGRRRGPVPHRGALSALIVFYAMGLTGMAFFLGVKTHPAAQRLGLAKQSRPPDRARASSRPVPRQAAVPRATDRPTTRRRRPARIRRVSSSSAERRRRVVAAVRRRPAQGQTARKPPGARKPLRTARRPAERLQQVRIVFVPRRSPDIAWVNPPPASWPKECRPPEPGSGRRF